MKLNFGHGILVVILLFMAWILTLVYKCSQQKVDLVSVNYYDQELKYENQIDKEKKSLALSENVKINYDNKTNYISIQYPSIDGIKNVQGTISFYKPDNASLDFNKPVVTNENNLQLIETSEIPAGLWNVKINWEVNAVSYFKEEKILVMK